LYPLLAVVAMLAPEVSAERFGRVFGGSLSLDKRSGDDVDHVRSNEKRMLERREDMDLRPQMQRVEVGRSQPQRKRRAARRGVRRAGKPVSAVELNATENPEAEEEDYIVMTLGQKMELEVGWFMYFLLFITMGLAYDSLSDMLEPPQAPKKLQMEVDSLEENRGFLHEAFWGDGKAAAVVNWVTIVLSLFNFYTFAVLTEAKMSDEEYRFGINVDAFQLNAIAELIGLPITLLFVGRLAAASFHPQWGSSGVFGPFRYFLWNGYTIVEAFALGVEFSYISGYKGVLGCIHGHNHFNLLWLFFLRVLEMVSKGHGVGIAKLTRLASESGKLLGVTFIFAFVVWILMSGLYFVANRTNQEETAVWEAAKFPDSEGNLQPWMKFASIPSSMWYVLINLCKEHPLADAHVTFFQRFNVCWICIFAMPVFALPTSVLQAALFPGNSSEEQEAKDAQAMATQAPRTVTARSFYSSLTTSILAFGSIMVYFFWTARNTTHSTLFNQPVHVSNLSLASVDGTVAAIFLVEWLGRILFNGPSYMVSGLGIIDLLAWAPGLAHTYVFLFQNTQVNQWLCAMMVFRVFKIERYLQSFNAMYKIARDNASLLSVTLLLSTIMWMVFSTLLYATERNSPDEEMRETYGSLMRSLWAEIINLHGEWPWADYTAMGKGVGCVIALFSIMIFCVPISIFGNGLSDVITADRTEEDKHFDRDPWQKRCRPQEEGAQQQAYDLLYAHLHVKYGHTSPLRFRIIRAVLLTLSIATTLTTLVMTLEKETLGEWYNTLWTVGMCIDSVAFVLFCLELGCRLFATDMQHAFTFIGLCDVISLVAFGMTLVPSFRDAAFHPDYHHTNNITDDCMVLLRLLRLFSMESYFAAIHVLKNVVWLNRWPLLRSGGGLVACWFVHATLLYLFEHEDPSPALKPGHTEEGADDEDDMTMAQRYDSVLRALQYSIVHLFGDFPESDYTFRSKVVHFVGIMVGIAIISTFTGVFIASFNDYLHAQRKEELSEKRLERAITMTRATTTIQRRFRSMRAFRERQAALGEAPQLMPPKSFLRSLALDCSHGGKLSLFFQGVLCFNLLIVLFTSLPEFNRHGEGHVSKTLLILEISCTGVFIFEYILNLIASRRFSYWRVFDLVCIFPGILEILYNAFNLNFRNLDDILEAALVIRVVRILHFPIIRREVTMICRSLQEAGPQLVLPAYLSVNVWITTSALFMWLENYYQEEGGEAENMTSVPAAMYWCCIFLTGEWANVDFTFAGSRLCIFYVIFGIAMFSIPVGIIVGSMQAAIEAIEIERADAQTLMKQEKLYLKGKDISESSTAAAAPATAAAVAAPATATPATAANASATTAAVAEVADAQIAAGAAEVEGAPVA